MTTHETGPTRRKFYKLTAPRAHRLQSGVTLARAATLAGLSMARASEIERHPKEARAGELDRLREAVNRAAAEDGEGA